MPKYWGKQIFTHGSFPEVGQSLSLSGVAYDYSTLGLLSEMVEKIDAINV